MVKYFAVVRQSPSYGLAVLAAVTALGILTVALNPAELDSALGMVLFVQMFLASTGFAVTARRGHFDPVLVHGSERTAVLFVQWCASIAPGAMAWLVVAGCGYAWSSAAAWPALTGSRAAAFVIVSAVAWVAGFALPRGGGGALWMGLLVALLLRHAELLAPSAAQDSVLAILRTAGALLICPFLLFGTHVQIGAPALSVSLAAAAVLLLVTIRLGSRLDVYLVERS
jgi:hypothetical protein